MEVSELAFELLHAPVELVHARIEPITSVLVAGSSRSGGSILIEVPESSGPSTSLSFI